MGHRTKPILGFRLPVFGRLEKKCHCLVKSGRSVEGNPVAPPKRGDVSGIMKDPLPVTVAEGDVREGGESDMGSDVEKAPLAGDDIIGSIPGKIEHEVNVTVYLKKINISDMLCIHSFLSNLCCIFEPMFSIFLIHHYLILFLVCHCLRSACLAVCQSA